MSTLRVAAINNPSASSGGLAISASGNVTGAGLDLITTQSFSAVSSVSVNNCFSAAYQNYKVVMTYRGSGAGQLLWRLRASGTDATGSNYYTQRAMFYGSTSNPARFAAEAFYRVGSTDANIALCSLTGDVFSPFAPETTVVQTQDFSNTDATNSTLGIWGAVHSLTTSYDGFTAWNNGGTITGTIRVYGYRN